MYTQIVGCVIMGYIVQHKSYMVTHCKSRFLRVMYIAISSGLCGSITSFSSWSLQCNKSFYLQWDTGPSNIQGSYNGGRLFEWGTCMIEGIAVPLIALHFGQFLASLSPYNEDAVMRHLEALELEGLEPKEEAEVSVISEEKEADVDTYFMMKESPLKELVLCIVFTIATLLILVLPTAVYPTWILFTYAGGIV